MARMHSRKRGKSGSTHPPRDIVPTWVKYDAEEVEKIVAKLGKKGKSKSEIGLIVRDKYGIPSVKAITKKSITDILKEKDLNPELPEDLKNLVEKAINLQEHLDKNEKDYDSKRGLQQVESKIKRITKYYRRKGKIPEDWKYTRENAKFLIEE